MIPWVVYVDHHPFQTTVNQLGGWTLPRMLLLCRGGFIVFFPSKYVAEASYWGRRGELEDHMLWCSCYRKLVLLFWPLPSLSVQHGQVCLCQAAACCVVILFPPFLRHRQVCPCLAAIYSLFFVFLWPRSRSVICGRRMTEVSRADIVHI